MFVGLRHDSQDIKSQFKCHPNCSKTFKRRSNEVQMTSRWFSRYQKSIQMPSKLSLRHSKDVQMRFKWHANCPYDNQKTLNDVKIRLLTCSPQISLTIRWQRLWTVYLQFIHLTPCKKERVDFYDALKNILYD